MPTRTPWLPLAAAITWLALVAPPAVAQRPPTSMLDHVPAPPPSYALTDLGVAGTQSTPWSINAQGQVVGYASLPAGGSHSEGFFHDGETVHFVGTPFGAASNDLLGCNDLGQAVGKTWGAEGRAILRLADGRVLDLGTLGGDSSYARSINDAGQVVGSSKLADGFESRPFVWQGGVMTALPLLGGTQGQATWINASGQVIGSSTTDTDGLQQFAVLWDGGTPTRLEPTHPGLNNIANFLHDNGDIVGSVKLPDGAGFDTRAALWRDGEVQVLGTLADGTPVEDAASSWASGVNAEGVIVGMSVNEHSALVPFVYRDGQMTQLDELMPEPWIATWVGDGAINDKGQIAVQALLPGGTARAVLLTPTWPQWKPF